MVTRLCIAFAGLFALCASLIGVTRAAARLADPPAYVAAVLPAGGCPAPCWQGLRPGQITGAQLDGWLAALPSGWTLLLEDAPVTASRTDYRFRFNSGETLSVNIIDLAPNGQQAIEVSHPALRLGDLLAALGPPAYLSFTRQDDGLGVRLFYPDHQLFARAALAPGDAAIAPELPIQTIHYHATPLSRALLGTNWRGLGKIGRYVPGGET
jgi:hypothetical protein